MELFKYYIAGQLRLVLYDWIINYSLCIHTYACLSQALTTVKTWIELVACNQQLNSMNAHIFLIKLALTSDCIAKTSN